MLVGVDKTSGAVTQVYAMEGGLGATPETNDLLHGNGGRAGIWMSGMGFSSDGQGRIFFVTGKTPSLSSGVSADATTPCNLPSKRLLFLYELLQESLV
jgi:hypothetical protein